MIFSILMLSSIHSNFFQYSNFSISFSIIISVASLFIICPIGHFNKVFAVIGHVLWQHFKDTVFSTYINI